MLRRMTPPILTSCVPSRPISERMGVLPMIHIFQSNLTYNKEELTTPERLINRGFAFLIFKNASHDALLCFNEAKRLINHTTHNKDALQAIECGINSTKDTYYDLQCVHAFSQDVYYTNNRFCLNVKIKHPH
jgi:hypothetical protein